MNNQSPATPPEHIAVIMDGNGRWAKSRGLPRTAGHKKGADSLRNLLNACRDLKVRYLTVYAFSAENWKRPETEVSDLMQLLKLYLNREIKTLHENGICVRFIGDLNALPADIRMLVDHAQTLTRHNKDFHLTIALSYGSRQELVRAMRHIAKQVETGALTSAAINEDMIEKSLDTAELPEPDLLIRTGGEHRLSNFLLWQCAYTELYFTNILWPDFTPAHLEEAIHDYSKRERRFGNAV